MDVLKERLLLFNQMWFWMESVSNWTGDVVDIWHYPDTARCKQNEKKRNVSVSYPLVIVIPNIWNSATGTKPSESFSWTDSPRPAIWISAFSFIYCLDENIVVFHHCFFLCSCSEFQSKTLFKDLVSHSTAQATQANKGQVQPCFIGSFTTDMILILTIIFIPPFPPSYK